MFISKYEFNLIEVVKLNRREFGGDNALLAGNFYEYDILNVFA